MPPISVLVASSERSVRKACQDQLADSPGVRVVGEARSGLQTLAMVGMLRPRIVLLDLSLWRPGGRPLIPAIRLKHPGTRVILLTQSESDGQMLDALSLGARGCLARDALPTFLLTAVRAIDAGEAWVPRKMVAQLMDRLFAAYSGGAPAPPQAADSSA